MALLIEFPSAFFQVSAEEISRFSCVQRESCNSARKSCAESWEMLKQKVKFGEQETKALTFISDIEIRLTNWIQA